MHLLIRFVAWLLAAGVAFVTLGPAESRPHSGFGQNGDHALAFVLIGVLFAFAYPQRRRSASMIAVVLIGALELMQVWAPGRHARLQDFLVDAGAALAGFALAAAAEALALRGRGRRGVLTSEGPAE
jgi:VanZ family protein